MILLLFALFLASYTEGKLNSFSSSKLLGSEDELRDKLGK